MGRAVLFLFLLGWVGGWARGAQTADSSWSSKKSFCAKTPEDFLQRSFNFQNITAFPNKVSGLNFGSCWWHSQLLRASLYLTVFNQPQATRPSSLQVEKILKKLMDMDTVLEIPGYKNWFDFSKENQDLIEDFLFQWKFNDTLQLEFIKGIGTSHGTDFNQLGQIIDTVQKQKQIAYVMVNYPGLPSHAWLVTKVIQTKTKLQFVVIDSSLHPYPMLFEPMINKYTYRPMESNDYYVVELDSSDYTHGQRLPTRSLGGKPISLKLQNAEDLQKFIKAQETYCKINK